MHPTLINFFLCDLSKVTSPKHSVELVVIKPLEVRHNTAWIGRGRRGRGRGRGEGKKVKGGREGGR